MIAKASGLEFIPAHKLQERYKKASVKSTSNDGDNDDDDESQQSSDESDDTSSYDSHSEDEEETGTSLDLDPEKKGTEIHLRNLQLKEKAASLMFDRLKLILQCCRCKNHEEVTVVPGKVLSVTCGKCSHQMLAVFRCSLAHQFSSVIGYLDLDNCTAFDLIFQDCKTAVTCLNCSKQTRIEVSNGCITSTCNSGGHSATGKSGNGDLNYLIQEILSSM